MEITFARRNSIPSSGPTIGGRLLSPVLSSARLWPLWLRPPKRLGATLFPADLNESHLFAGPSRRRQTGHLSCLTIGSTRKALASQRRRNSSLESRAPTTSGAPAR